MDSTQPTTQAPAPVESPKNSSTGVIIGTVVILAAIVLGAWYLSDKRLDLIQGEEASTVNSLQEQGTSTDNAAIENDLSAESPDDFDKGVDEAFTELDASFDAQ